MRHHVIGLLTIAFVAVAVHVSSSQSSAQSPFRAVLDEDWKYWMAQYPETATLLDVLMDSSETRAVIRPAMLRRLLA